MRATRIGIGPFVALLALTSCDGTTPQEPAPPAVLVLEAVTPVSVTGVVGEDLDVAPVVLVMGDGRPVKGIQVSFVASDSGFVGSATVMTDAAGLASPGSWRLGPGAGAQTLTARAGGHSLVVTAEARPGAVALLALVGGNWQGAAAGTALFAPLRVGATDRYRNVVTDAAVTFTVVDGGGSLHPGASFTGPDGIAESRWTLGTTAGIQRVRVQSGNANAQFMAEAWVPAPCSVDLAYVFYGNILICDGAMGSMRLLTTDGLGSEPAWSPGGERIAFTRYGLGIYVLNPDGTGVTRLIDDAPGTAWSRSPTWSPRGDALAFTGFSDSGSAVYVQELSEGSVPRRVAWGVDPAWSPDGSRIAFVSPSGFDDYYSLGLAHSDGSGSTEIMPVEYGYMSQPAWSPDGTLIAFSRCNSAWVCDIHVIRPDGSGLTRLTKTGNASSPAWSPDGTRIAYAHMQYELGATRSRIMMIPAGGGDPVMLIASGQSPSWRSR